MISNKIPSDEVVSDFIKQFTDKEIFDTTLSIGRKIFYVPKELREIKIKQEPVSIGIFLGEQRKEGFYPSLALIDIISKHSDKKAFVKSEAEWLFLCGRDVVGKNIMECSVRRGLVLVQNVHDENLGYGNIPKVITRKDQMGLKNVLDRGDFLRREMHK